MEVKLRSPRKTKKSSSKFSRLPSIPINLCHVISDQNIAKITVEGLKLITREGFDSIYNKIKNLHQDNIPTIIEFMRSMEISEQGILVEKLAWILQLNNNRSIERLIAEGEPQNENEANGTYLCRVFVDNFSVFHNVAQRSFCDFLFEKRSFTIFTPTKAFRNIDNFRFTPDKVDIVRDKCRAYFKSRSYSDYCDPISGNYGPKNHGLEINRGSREDGSAKIKNNKIIFNPDRYKKSDVMFIDRETGLLWISVQNTNRSDLDFYRKLLSKIIMGDEEGFQVINFDFSFIHDDGLDSLDRKKIGEIEKILLREVRYRSELGMSHKGPFTTNKSQEDCLTKYPDFMDNRKEFTSFTSIKLHIFLKNGLKDEIIIKEHSVSTRNQINESDMMGLLSDLNIMPQGHCDA